MTTVFDDAPNYYGICGDNALVAHTKDHVRIRVWDDALWLEATIAMTPAQARALAQGIIAAADRAEAGE